MKRNHVLFLLVLVGAGLLLWRGFGHQVSSGEDVASPTSISKSSKVPPQGEASQASSAPESDSAVAGSASTVSSAEPVLFKDNPARLRNSNNRPLPKSENTGAAPASSESLRASNLWAGQDWKIWKGVSAVPKTSYQGNEGRELGTLGSFVIVENANIISNEHQFSSEAPLAVFNTTRNRAGIVTGDFAVTLQDAGDFESFILDHDLKIKDAFPHLRLFYVTSGKEPVDLVLLMEALGKDPRVEKVNLEIVTQSYAKK